MSWIFATGVAFQPANDRQYLRVSLYTSSNLHGEQISYTPVMTCI